MRKSGYIAAGFLALACLFTLATHAAFSHAVPDARTRHKLTRPALLKTALLPGAPARRQHRAAIRRW